MTTLILLVVAVYVIAAYVAAVPVCRTGFANSFTVLKIGAFDIVMFTLGWLISPLWMPVFLLGRVLFCGIKSGRAAR